MPMAGEAGKVVHVDIVSDVMCPWCYIGKRHLEAASGMIDGVRLEIAWRPFQLDPTLPPQGKDRRKYLEDKFGGPEGAKAAYAQVTAAGAKAGIAFDFPAIKVSPNTLDAHRLIRWAGGAGAATQDRVVNRLFELYFEEGGNVGDRALLARVADDAGMDGKLVGELLASDADRDAVRNEIAAAQRMGITGVPCFIFDMKKAAMGAQPAETLAAAILQAAAAPEPAATQ
jgi:predicted DsbA family dithiol-disulfide isomerase